MVLQEQSQHLLILSLLPFGGNISEMEFRPVTVEDAEDLVGATPEGSSPSEITVEVTREWIAKDDPTRIHFIAEVDGKPIGSVRSNLRDGKYNLSYFLLPEARGKGYGKEMVFTFANTYHHFEPLRCVIKKGNIASEKIAAWFKLQPVKEEGDFITWEDPSYDREIDYALNR